MQVIDFLAAMDVAVDDETIAIGGDAFLLRKVARHGNEVADQGLVVIRDIVRGGNEFIRHDQNVRRRARPDVAKRRDARIAVNDLGGQFARDDALEKSIHASAASLAGGREAGNSLIISHTVVSLKPGSPP